MAQMVFLFTNKRSTGLIAESRLLNKTIPLTSELPSVDKIRQKQGPAFSSLMSIRHERPQNLNRFCINLMS
jgi:hypothetical protein